MHLVINATEIGRQRGGNESFVNGLIEGLSALGLSRQVSLLTCQSEAARSFPATFQQLDLGRYRRLPFFLWQQARALHRLEADWYLATFFLPLSMPCQGAVVVHDLSFRAHPEYFPRIVAWYMRWLTSRAIQRAQRVFTISEFSRREILRFHPANREKVVVIPCGVASRFRPATSEMNLATEWATLARYGINGSYILALGNIHPRKNLVRLLEAYLCLRRQRKSVPRMVWAGLPRWDSNRLLDKARAAGVILTGFVAEDDLPILYRQATMLVYPSIYEGFGLPPLEAMACGTPVVASNATSLPEVVGEAALTVNTTDVTEITTAMARLLDDTPLRKQLQESGLERAREFTWARAARELLAWLER